MSVLSETHLAICSDEKPTLDISKLSPDFGLPFGEKAMNCGADAVFN
jgi:hypothetical protein